MFLCAFWDNLYYAWGVFIFLTESFFSSAFYLNFQFVPFMTPRIKLALETATHKHWVLEIWLRDCKEKDHKNKFSCFPTLYPKSLT